MVAVCTRECKWYYYYLGAGAEDDAAVGAAPPLPVCVNLIKKQRKRSECENLVMTDSNLLLSHRCSHLSLLTIRIVQSCVYS